MSRLVFLAAVLLAGAAACIKTDDLTAIRPGTVFAAARDTFFTPDTITVEAGFPVRWTNEGTVLHAVVSDSGLWASNLLQPQWWFEVTFDSIGTYPYHCSQHDSIMRGTVIVQ